MVTTFTVTGTWVDDLNAPETGYVEFTPNSPRFANGGVIVEGRTCRANLDSTGHISITLVRCTTGYTAREYIGAGGLGSTQSSGAEAQTKTITDQAGPVDLSTL